MSFTKKTLILWIYAVILLVVSSYVAGRLGVFPFTLLTSSAAEPEMRGVWVQQRSLLTKEKVDDLLQRAEAGHFNAVFVDIFTHGQALYKSKLVSTYDRVDPGFDPLDYLVGEAHRRGLKVHAWFVSGRVSYGGYDDILSQHPDWELIGPDGKKSGWLNFSRPDVQKFFSRLVLEVVENYRVDGVHFDYFRYPGPEWGFDPYSIKTFSQAYGFDLNELRYADLPAYARFNGNPLSKPATAQVLATFGNGQPAVALNAYGQGQVILLNWDANKRQVAVSSEILQRSLKYLLKQDGTVYILHSETNLATYSSQTFERGVHWLEELGWKPTQIGEADISNLPANAVLVMPNVYLITPEVAANLAQFVDRGGGVIFLDGPSRSIRLPDIQLITGMQASGGHFNETMLMVPTVEHPLIPASTRDQDVSAYELKAEQWRTFRKAGLNKSLEEIYQRIKADHPEVVVSVTITSDQEAANHEVLQDWPTWLDGQYLDLLIPRGFVDQTQALEPVLAAWRPVMQTHTNITLGLISFAQQEEALIPKSPEQLLTEIKLARAAGSRNLMIFNIINLSDDQLKALAADAPPAPGSHE